MARKQQLSAHERLEELRRQAVDERVRARDVEARLETAELTVEQASQRVIEALADGDQKAIALARQAAEQATIRVHELQEQLAGARLRVERAQQAADGFAHDHADELLDERMAAAEQITTRLNAAVHEALGLQRQLINERQELDRIITAGGGSPRLDGPPSEHPWERALAELERVVKQHPQLEVPAPRWQGRALNEQRDRVHRLLRMRRKGDQTAVEDFERGAA